MSKRFDATIKGLLEYGPEDWPALAGSPQRPVEAIDADVSTFTSASDMGLRVHDLWADWLLDVNFQRGPDARLPRRMRLYNGLLDYQHNLQSPDGLAI